MNKYIASASIAAIVLAYGSVAQAQALIDAVDTPNVTIDTPEVVGAITKPKDPIITPADPYNGPSLAEVIGQPLIDHMALFKNGNQINQAINISNINASVNVVGVPNYEESTKISGGFFTGVSGGASVEGSTADLDNPLAAAGQFDVDFAEVFGAKGSIKDVVNVGNAVFKSSDVVKIVAAGAINTGDMADASHVTNNVKNNVDKGSLGQVVFAKGEMSDAGASTSNTASAAVAAEGVYASLGNVTWDVNKTVEKSSSGPAFGFIKVNQAINFGDINGSLNVLSNGTDLAGIATTAVGAINNGTMAAGYDGSAFKKPATGEAAK